MDQYNQPPGTAGPSGNAPGNEGGPYGTPPPWGYGPPPPPPRGGYPPPYVYPPPPPQVVHIVAKSGGFKSAVMWVLAMILFAGMFIVGIMTGVGAMLAESTYESIVLREQYREGLFATNAIAVLPIEGVITQQTADFARAAVDEIIEDNSVRAVILRVDSPGGEVAASDQIWYQVERLKSTGLKVVASYGGLAASGGYYVSCGADHIVAEPTCITGSIGVIAQVFTMEQLMEKIGVQPVTLVASQSPSKDVANNMFRSWTDDDRAKLGKVLDAAYATFRKRVETGRASVITDPSRLDAVADGSIYTADEALLNGLVDGIGYMDDAIAKAEQLAKLQPKSARVFILREPPTFFGNGIFGQAQSAARAARSPGKGELLDGDRIRALLDELSAPHVAYLMH